jgi:hypothetical protein
VGAEKVGWRKLYTLFLKSIVMRSDLAEDDLFWRVIVASIVFWVSHLTHIFILV